MKRLASGVRHLYAFWFAGELFGDIVGNGNGVRSLKLDQDCESGIDACHSPVESLPQELWK